MKETKKEQHWFEDENDLANKSLSNIIWWGFWTSLLVVGSKHIAYNGINLKGALVALLSILMLWYQIHILEKKVEYWRNNHNRIELKRGAYLK